MNYKLKYISDLCLTPLAKIGNTFRSVIKLFKRFSNIILQFNIQLRSDLKYL